MCRFRCVLFVYSFPQLSSGHRYSFYKRQHFDNFPDFPHNKTSKSHHSGVGEPVPIKVVPLAERQRALVTLEGCLVTTTRLFRIGRFGGGGFRRHIVAAFPKSPAFLRFRRLARWPLVVRVAGFELTDHFSFRNLKRFFLACLFTLISAAACLFCLF